MKLRSFIGALLLSISIESFSSETFPRSPDRQVTPGALCNRADQIRYPEKISYCNRDVRPELKAEVIQTYDRQLGYSVGTMKRGLFKIDHYIPLCAGGSNERENLWPQHQSVYKITDPLEAAICEKMAQGKLKQVHALELIREGKSDLKSVESLLKQVHAL